MCIRRTLLVAIVAVPLSAPITLQSQPTAGPVTVIQPKKPSVAFLDGYLEAESTVHIHASVSGFLDRLAVDLGQRVQKGQVLAVIRVPDLEAEVRMGALSVQQAEARLQRARAAVNTAKAELDVLKSAIIQAETNKASLEAKTRYYELKVKRYKELVANKAVDPILLDEAIEELNAARAGEDSARAGIATAKAKFAVGVGRVEQAMAEVAVVTAEVGVADATLQRSKERLASATLVAPFDGIITKVNYAPGAFLRADQPAGVPLLTIERVDRMRVVVWVGQAVVPAVAVGSPVVVEVPAYPGKRWPAKVSRIGVSLDAKTRAMRVEIDLPNPTGELRSNMPATATLELTPPAKQR